jgi:hypothetical protein
MEMVTALNEIGASPLKYIISLPSPMQSLENLPQHRKTPSIYAPPTAYISPYPPLPLSSSPVNHQMTTTVCSSVPTEHQYLSSAPSSIPAGPAGHQTTAAASTSGQSDHQKPSCIPSPPLTDYQNGYRQLPGRQAAAKARLTWSTLKETGYLSENSGDDDSDNADSSMAQSSRKRGLGKFWEASDSESNSDDYIYEPATAKSCRMKGTGGRGGLKTRPRKIRRVTKLAWGDKEVINGTDNNGVKSRRKAGGSMGMKNLDFLTKAEAERLVYYVLGKTDWEDAAAFVYGETLVKTEENRGGEEKRFGVDTQTRWTITDRLKAHWRQTLGRKLVNLYID